jgi:hypothetical protein
LEGEKPSNTTKLDLDSRPPSISCWVLSDLHVLGIGMQNAYKYALQSRLCPAELKLMQAPPFLYYWLPKSQALIAFQI